eukprot:m.818 g.818  ORF g.818 m.818 type:complete len:217 (+) comp4952_c0_seq1:3-653(+)
MLQKGIIRPSTSPFAAPICPVRKKNGKLRLCIDYRELNQVTVSTAFPTSHLLSAVESMSGAKYFSTIDLAQGYFQVPMAEEDKHKTAFRTQDGLWEFNRMPFRLKGAPATFCAMMTKAMQRMSPLHFALYMDDICVFSESFSEHLLRLRDLFSTLSQQGLRLNAKKCRFAAIDAVFCGHYVSEDGIRPDSTKIEAITAWSLPRLPRELKSFLGAVG